MIIYYHNIGSVTNLLQIIQKKQNNKKCKVFLNSFASPQRVENLANKQKKMRNFRIFFPHLLTLATELTFLLPFRRKLFKNSPRHLLV